MGERNQQLSRAGWTAPIGGGYPFELMLNWNTMKSRAAALLQRIPCLFSGRTMKHVGDDISPITTPGKLFTVRV